MKTETIDELITEEQGRVSPLLSDLIKHSISDRDAIQIKLIDKFKYEWSERVGYDLGLDFCMTKWVNNGYAKEYSNLWKTEPEQNKHLIPMYNRLKRWEEMQNVRTYIK